MHRELTPNAARQQDERGAARHLIDADTPYFVTKGEGEFLSVLTEQSTGQLHTGVERILAQRRAAERAITLRGNLDELVEDGRRARRTKRRGRLLSCSRQREAAETQDREHPLPCARAHPPLLAS
jgi:hypothetical protein